MKLKRLSVLLFAVGVSLCGSGMRAYAAETFSAPDENLQETAQGALDAQTEITDVTAKPEEILKPEEPEVIEDEDKETEEVDKPKPLISEQKAAEKKTAVKREAYSRADLRLMAAIIYCEAGWEPYAGKLAVGIVVKNRQESGRFPGTIKGVIYQPYQFGPARNGALSKALARYDAGKFTSGAEKECIRAAKAALGGEKTIGYKGKTINMKSYYYFSGRVSGARLRIANHQFK